MNWEKISHIFLLFKNAILFLVLVFSSNQTELLLISALIICKRLVIENFLGLGMLEVLHAAV